MSLEGQEIYPGEGQTPECVLLRAEEYRLAAEALRSTIRRGKPLSRAPYGLLVIHAIELYLNAYLLIRNFEPAKVRGLQHNLASRAKHVADAGLKLKKGTAQHLQSLTDSREYLVARYGGASQHITSELTRLAATLSDVARKVTAAVNAKRGNTPSPGR